ncbi:MAG: hypothetical protein D3903_01645 [Candidatus Electrothrix sp. GM3_4]|nr:hypothetical protein [Candidatus Electrothrix sp. GM3_4]
MTTLQIRQVNRQGQISIGKKHSGRKVEISEYSDGTVVLRPVEVISEFELRLLKEKAFQQRLGGFSRWEKENAPAETDLAALEDNLEA